MGDTIIMNETDLELLIWAAKADGIECGIIHGEIRIRCDAGWTPWNPITDDGDALRLAVKLGLHLSQQLSYVAVMQPHGGAGSHLLQWIEQYNNDPLAATRRAIVCAAAEIGRNMK